MSLVSLYFWSRNPYFVSFLRILWPCLGKVCVAFEGFLQDSQSLFNEVASSGVLRQQFISSEEVSPESNVDETLMAALSECYGAASNWATRRQILSIMADKVRYKTLLKYVPDLTKYRYTEAKRHCLTHGRGMPVLHERAPRRDVSPCRLNIS